MSNVEFIAAGAYPEDVDRATIMLVEREPGLSPVDARQDVEGHFVDLLEMLRPFRSPNSSVDADA